MTVTTTLCKNTTRVCEWRKVMVKCKEKPEDLCENENDCTEDTAITCKNVMKKKQIQISKKVPTKICR